MAHILIFAIFIFALSETLPLHETRPPHEGKDIEYLNNAGVPVSESVKYLHKRQTEDFGPPDDFANKGQDGRNRTNGGNRPWDQRGGGRHQLKRGNHTRHGCDMMGRNHRRPPTDETEEVSLFGEINDRYNNELVKTSGFKESPNHGGRGRKFHRRRNEECKEEGDGNGDTSTSTTSSPNDD